MKKSSYICGVHAKNILTLLGAGFFISASLGARRIHGSSIPDGFCTVRSEIVLGGTGDSTALFSCPYYNFSFMPRTMKNCKGAQGASIATSAHDTRKSLYSKVTIEKNAKNMAYAFILSSGLLSEFAEFSRACNSECDTPIGRLSLIIENC